MIVYKMPAKFIDFEIKENVLQANLVDDNNRPILSGNLDFILKTCPFSTTKIANLRYTQFLNLHHDFIDLTPPFSLSFEFGKGQRSNLLYIQLVDATCRLVISAPLDHIEDQIKTIGYEVTKDSYTALRAAINQLKPHQRVV